MRSSAKGHGLGNRIEGVLREGQSCVVIEDLVSTGKSSLEACAALQAAGARVVGLVSIFNYGFPQAQQAFQQAGIPFLSLSHYEALITLAAEQGKIAREDLELLMQWREAPEKWGQPAA